jgi:hypothetical protein
VREADICTWSFTISSAILGAEVVRHTDKKVASGDENFKTEFGATMRLCGLMWQTWRRGVDLARR